MKELTKSKEIEWLGSTYRITRHIGSEVIEIEERVGTWWGSYYKRLYFGHINPLEEALEFFKQSKINQ